MSEGRPSEARTRDLWSKCSENMLVKTSTGLLTAGALSFIFLRRPSYRGAFATFGAGIGAGIAWMDCRLSFADKKWRMLTLKNPFPAGSKIGGVKIPTPGELASKLGINNGGSSGADSGAAAEDGKKASSA
eukprot:TRINITY_DN47518_c0_g1_i1.p2 TRINITY_DN47518_c0_g1~~TRINITY_DN47518_c0_g1_i1.p2  ORF type:complete len:146 (+),score=67.50 TRINITY_DN47518_c0_g1_i1:46-438(+)